MTGQKYLSFVGAIEAEKEMNEGGLPDPGLPHQRGNLEKTKIKEVGGQ